MRYVWGAVVVVLLISINNNIKATRESLITWRCNQTGLCSGWEDPDGVKKP